MDVKEATRLSPVPDYLMPAVEVDGSWGSAGGVALRDALKRGSAAGLMALVKSMDARGVAASLRESGFAVDPSVVALGRAAVFASVKGDLNEALSLGVNGFELTQGRALVADVGVSPVIASFAAKAVAVPVVAPESVSYVAGVDAASLVQAVFKANTVEIELLGDASPGSRGALLLVAGQALKKGIQGFGFDGLPGKYQVTLGITDLLALHREAAQVVAVDSARIGLGSWAAGDKVHDLDGWVPDSVQRLLHGSVSLAAAQAVIEAIESGSVELHAGQIGTHEFTALLASQGVDVAAATVADKAVEFGWTLQVPNRSRGMYFGPVVALDHRAGLVKFTRSDVLELPFKDLAAGQDRPKIGDLVRMDFKGGDLAVNVSARPGREGASR